MINAWACIVFAVSQCWLNSPKEREGERERERERETCPLGKHSSLVSQSQFSIKLHPIHVQIPDVTNNPICLTFPPPAMAPLPTPLPLEPPLPPRWLPVHGTSFYIAQPFLTPTSMTTPWSESKETWATSASTMPPSRSTSSSLASSDTPSPHVPPF